MSLRPLLPFLRDTAEFQEIASRLRSHERNVLVTVLESGISYAIASAWDELQRPMICVTPTADDARRLTDQLIMWLGAEVSIHQFSELETLPFERLSPDSVTVQHRVQALAALARSSDEEAQIIVCSVNAAAQTVVSASAFIRATHEIVLGENHAIEDLTNLWVSMGYSFKAAVENPGDASRRGGILDVYPPSADAPVRIEFFGDEVDGIREFDPATQRSTKTLERVTIDPALDSLPGLAETSTVENLIGKLNFGQCDPESSARIYEELSRIQDGERIDGFEMYSGFVNHDSIFDYLPSDCITVVTRPSEVETSALTSDERIVRQKLAKERRREIPSSFAESRLGWGLVADRLYRRGSALRIAPWGVTDDVESGAPVLPIKQPPVIGVAQDQLWAELSARQKSDTPAVLLSQHAPRLAELVVEHNLRAEQVERLTEVPANGTATVVPGHLRRGFSLEINGVEQLLVLTDTETFGVTKEPRPVRRKTARRVARLQDLKSGAYLVHIEHGIGRFIGTTTMEGESAREYMVLEYAEDDKLYVPMEQLDRLSPYYGSGDSGPKLTRLGTQEWSKAKARAKRMTEQMAGELITLYASREVTEGIQAGEDTPWQDQLEASFEFEETPDQLSAIVEVKADMEAGKPMDRLVSGDVGYGKTEIAVRAAFKAAQAGFQVAILVPTTILAQQHLVTFNERLAGFPVGLGALSRLVSSQEQARVLKGINNGEIDIVIGTHKLLQKNIRFKNLGLLIIDEEHRFGVSHKERLKRLRHDVDVMTMSATPIPRTLYISLAGIRDMSTIDTPPEDRLPIKTFVTEDSKELVREAILRELDRGGQVFYVHNRVKSIDYFAGELRKLVPEARIGVGHGRMQEGELDEVMRQFSNGVHDVLVCTTIIESGLDLPNVNTLLIDRADRFGLSQLYQLRGRIGRGSRRAYSYFLVERGRRITESAEQRLNTIALATELGAGYQIAMRDLEIRGAGNILGAEQSGQIAAIGFDLYTRLLKEAVQMLRSKQDDAGPEEEQRPEFSLVQIDLGIDARLPYTYVEDLAERLAIYQRIAMTTNVTAIDDMNTELIDRFGPLPKPAELLLYTVRARIMSEEANVVSINSRPDRLTLNFKDPTGGARTALQKTLGRGITVGNMQIRMDIDRDDDDWQEELLWVLQNVVEFRERALKMLELVGELAASS